MSPASSAGTISAGTAMCGVILHPASHTRSPAMHNAAFEKLGIDGVYLAFDVEPKNLADALRGARALGVRQLAVSIPHKTEVMAYLDEIDETAKRIGAVNTITRDGERLIGSNTDWQGAVRALEEQGDASLAGTRACVLGAGGAARSVVYGLLQRGARVTVLNRTRERADELCHTFNADAAGSLEDLADIDYDVLVNTTRVGLGEDVSPAAASALREGSLVLDAVYDPPDTRLLRDARSAGAKTVGGKWWLVYQAAEQLTLWSGESAPVEVMANAFDQAS